MRRRGALADLLLSQSAFIQTSYIMMGVSVVGMVLNVALYLTHVITVADLILVTLVLSWLALMFAGYGNIISAQVNKKVENLNADEVTAGEMTVGEVNVGPPNPGSAAV